MPEDTISNPAPPSSDDDTLLHRGLGVPSIVLMVLAAAAPLAVVAANVPVMLMLSSSTAIPLFFLIAAGALILFAVGFTLMSKYVRNAGAFYTYVQEGLGRRMGIGAAMLALVSYTMLVVGESAYVGTASANLIRHFLDRDTPWWLWALAALLVIAFLGYRDIDLSSKVLGVLLTAETLIVIVLTVAIFARGGDAGLHPDIFAPRALFNGSPAIGLMFAILSFIGFEATAVFRSEAKDPDRTIPRATYIAVIGIGILYALSGWAVVAGSGAANAIDAATADPANMVLDLATRYVGPVAHNVMQVLLLSSLFACTLSFHNVISRYLFALGRTGVLPRKLGQVSPRHRAPSSASIVMSAVTLALLIIVILSGMDPVSQAYTWLLGTTVLGVVVLMALTSAAVVVYFRRTGHDRRVWNTAVAPIAALLLLVALTVVVVVNFDLLIPDPVAALVMGSCVPLSFAVGLGIAQFMKMRRPQAYAQLEDEPSPSSADRVTSSRPTGAKS